MKVVHYNPKDKASIIAEALVTLLSGGTVVYPTETSYALGADFCSPHAYRAVYTIKYRSLKKPLPVIVPDIDYATTLVQFTPEASDLAMRYWPGPLTLVLPFIYTDLWSHHTDSYLALRVSSHPLAANLAKAFGRPVIATSANVSGEALCYNVHDIIAQMRTRPRQPDLIIDAGELPAVEPSTVVKVDDEGLSIVRQGPIHIQTRTYGKAA